MGPGGNAGRFVIGDLVNRGRVDVDATSTGNPGSDWTNSGTLDIAAGAIVEQLGSYAQTSESVQKTAIVSETSSEPRSPCRLKAVSRGRLSS